MLKRGFAFALALVMLVSVASAVEAVTPDGDTYEVSAWAQKDVAEAWNVGLYKGGGYENYRMPADRSLLGQVASRLVALAFGGDYDAYTGYRGLQRQIKDQPWGSTVAEELGLLQGREDGDMDYDAVITRQEAAVVLARAYRLYCDEVHDDAEPLSYADSGMIADWAEADVQLMTHLGVMNGVGENKFNPQGTCTIEQCLVTVVRLYENTCKGKPVVENDFFDLTPRQAAISQAYRPVLSCGSAENDKTFAVVYNTSGAYIGPTRMKVVVVDAAGTCAEYRTVIKESHNIFWGAGENGQSDAAVDKIWLSEDGSKVYYQSTLEEDVYPYYPDGTYGELLFAKGVYTVTLDVASGKQTYTREDLR